MFVALIIVEQNIYRGGSSFYEEIHLVEAESEEEAIGKIRDHYDNKSEPYSLYYTVEVKSINEIIK